MAPAIARPKQRTATDKQKGDLGACEMKVPLRTSKLL